jgi:hypothetical protein
MIVDSRALVRRAFLDGIHTLQIPQEAFETDYYIGHPGGKGRKVGAD